MLCNTAKTSHPTNHSLLAAYSPDRPSDEYFSRRHNTPLTCMQLIKIYLTAEEYEAAAETEFSFLRLGLRRGDVAASLLPPSSLLFNILTWLVQMVASANKCVELCTLFATQNSNKIIKKNCRMNVNKFKVADRMMISLDQVSRVRVAA